MLYILLLLLLFLGFIVVRALLFRPRKKDMPLKMPVQLDYDKAVQNFSRIIQYPTVSRYEGIGEDEALFTRFVEALPSMFPNLYAGTTFEKVGRRGLLFRWRGKSHEKAAVLMAHYDVVPVDESMWTFPPFCGEIRDNMLLGRGTLDTKGTFCAVMQIADTLIAEGFVPKEDIYLAFSGEEEIHGSSADDIAKKLKAEGVTFSIVLDEGGAVVEHIFKKDGGRIAVIGIAEKGVADLELSIKGDGGHASQPPARGLVGKLSKAIARIESHPMPIKLNSAFVQLIDSIGRDAAFPLKLIFANLKIFKPLIAKMSAKKGGELNAMIRTSFAFTKLAASDAINVMPTRVSAGINVRCLKGDDEQAIIRHIQKAAKCEGLTVNSLYYEAASEYSRTEGEAWDLLKNTIEMTWTDACVTPYLMIAASDSRHYSKLCDRVYRFSAMEMRKEERKLIHGNDERIRLEEWYKTLDFYYRFIKQL